MSQMAPSARPSLAKKLLSNNNNNILVIFIEPPEVISLNLKLALEAARLQPCYLDVLETRKT